MKLAQLLYEEDPISDEIVGNIEYFIELNSIESYLFYDRDEVELDKMLKLLGTIVYKIIVKQRDE